MGEFVPAQRARPRLLELDARILPSFTPLTPFTTGVVTPIRAASADFNGDGLDDLAVFNSSGGNAGRPFVSVLLSTGAGQFTQSAALDQTTNDFPTALIAADFNGDGRPDLAAASSPLGSLHVYTGNGDGTFAQTFLDPSGTLGLGSGDFNGDGLTDLVALQSQISGPNVYVILLSNGAGGFAAGVPVTAAFNNSRILTGDLDGNGTIDFASLDSTGHIAAYLGNGDGTFGAAILTAAPNPRDFALADFDGDGRPDVVTNESGTLGFDVLALHSNTGGGTFGTPGVQFYSQGSSGIRLASTDFDSNGQPDVVTANVFNQVGAVYRTGATFTPDARNPYLTNGFTRDIVTGDFDGDHHPDFATLGGGTSGNEGIVFLNDLPDSTTTTLNAVPVHSFVGTPITLTATVALQHPGSNPNTPQGTVTFTSGSTVLGTATLSNGVATLTVSMPVGVSAIVATYSGSAAVVGGTGYVVPFQSALLTSRSAPATVIVKDYDKPEFVVGTDNGPVVCYRNGDGIHVKDFGDFLTDFPGVRPGLGDFNGDGVSDAIGGSGPGIVAQVTIDDGVSLLPIFAAQPFDGFQGGVFVASADFNGDGIADFAVGADAGGEPRICVYLSAGGTFVQAASFFAFERGFRGGVRLAAGDVDGDGTPDLIVGAGPGAGPAVAVFDGKQLAQGVARRLIDDFYAYAPEFRGGVFVAAGDVNRDGYADIITGAGNGPPHVTAVSGLSLSTGGRQLLASFLVADPAINQGGIRVAAHDLNRDGYSEIIAGAGVGNGSTAWGYSGIALATVGAASPLFAQEVFPGLYAGVYVG